jgi:MraZ protein
MFRGRSAHVLDVKGRLSIPARFKGVLQAKYDGRLIVTNVPSCLAAYPFEEWRKIEKQFSQFQFGPPEVVAFKRYLLGAAAECSLDGQGRILIPLKLREEAELTKEVVLSGMLTYFEISSKDNLNKELQKTRNNFDQYSSDITAKFGISG